MRIAVELAPDAVPLLMEFGQFLASNGHADEAMDAFRRVTALQPASPEAWYFLGMALYAARRDADALPAFRFQCVTPAAMRCASVCASAKRQRNAMK